jgi:hypothetical protein
MKPAALAAALAGLALIATPALADPPKFTATCPGGVTVKSNGSGKVKINGKKVMVMKLSSTSWQASLDGTKIDIGQDGSKVYVSSQGTNICEVTAGSSGADVSSIPEADQQACLKAVAKMTNNARVIVLDAIGSEANNSVTIGVGKDKAKWQCLVKNGRVAEVMSLTDEGGL